MSDVDTGDILRIGCGLSLQGIHDVVNVWHIRADLVSGVTWATMIPTIQAYADNLYDDIKGRLSDLMGTNVISLANATQATTVGSIAWSPTWAGTEAGEVTAPGVSCFVWGRTYTPRVQIRKYFGCFTEAGITDGVWVAGLQDDCVLSMEYHRISHDMGSGITLTGVAYNRTLLTSVEAVSSDASAEPAYQRRRRRGRGS